MTRGFPFLRGFRDPVVIIGTPFCTQTADDPDDAYVTGRYSQFENMSGAESPSIKWQIQVVEIIYPDRWKVHARN